MFVDRIRVFAQAGDGGRGCVSFRREKFVPKGGPDGGDGGRGGDVILKADSHVDNLSALFYEPLIKAKKGGHGQGKKMHGRSAPDKIVKVPIGTVVYQSDQPLTRAPHGASVERDGGLDADTDRRSVNQDAEGSAANAQRTGFDPQDEMDVASPPTSLVLDVQSPTGRTLADLASEGQEFVLVRGGKGGKGNVHFKSSRNRAPREYTEGQEGEQGHFLFELRTIADAGLVGYPNAGKSTLLGKISAARPKVAAYPFTTLHPIVGVVEFPGYRRATVADIPGLIEGAHRNVGLGHDFLRHITRCQLLVFVVDTAGSEGRSPLEDLHSLRREVDLYDARLSRRRWMLVANKMDLPGADENLHLLRSRFKSITILPVSAAKGEGIDELKRELAGALAGQMASSS